MRYNYIIIGLFCLLISSPLPAISEFPFKGQTSLSMADDYCYQSAGDTTSDLWLVHSSRMALGRPFTGAYNVADDEEQIGNLPFNFGANFPGRSPGQYLNGAGLWIGGIKGNDTLVAHAFDFVNATPELIPPACPEGAIVSGPGLADMEYIAVAYDTIIAVDTLFRCQLGDCNDWYPLGLKVTSHSYAWQSPPFDRTVIVEYTVKNIDALPLEKGWVGIYADCDVGSGEDIHIDDISGHLGGVIDGTGSWVDLDIGYSLDMNGDAGRLGYDDFTANGVFGVQVLGLTAADYRVNFNWWIDNPNTGQDWGPRQIESEYRDLGGGYAAPRGDSNKYFVMSYPETDYNQVESGLLHPGWAQPGETGAAITFGGDTRFVISAGPFDLAPGEEVTFTVAYIAGNNALANSYIYTWWNPTDPQSVSDYYEILDLDEFKASALAAAAIFENGFDFPPPGPPAGLALTAFDDEYASFAWSRQQVSDLDGYHLRVRQGDSVWIAADCAPDDTAVTLTGLDPDTEYAFSVASFDLGDAVGRPTEEITLRPGAPHPPEILTGTARNARPHLNWSPSVDPEIAFYRLYRIDAAGDTLIVDEPVDTFYIDPTAQLAQTYVYFVTAVADNGYESPPSATVELMPLMPTSGILVIDQNPGNIAANPAFDASFFESLLDMSLADIGYTYHRYTDADPLTVFDVARYSLVILGAENLHGFLNDDMAAVLGEYLANGGQAIVILRHAAVDREPEAEEQVIRHAAGSLFSDLFLIDSSYIGPLRILPGYQLAGDLFGADPVNDLYPALDWDSVRVNSFGYSVPDGLPYTGYLWPRAPAETIFTYRSADPDSSTHGRVNGIRYLGDDYGFYLINFPLSLMEIDSAAAFLRSVVFELGEDFICGDVNGDYRLDIADATAYAGYLFRGGQPPAMAIAGDVNCDGEYSMADLMILINFYFFRGISPDCCR